MIKQLVAAVAFAALAFTSAPSFAQASPMELSSTIQLVKPVEADGTVTGEDLVEPSSVVPGDTLEFTINYTNTGADTATDFVVTNPVHKDTVVAPESAASTEVSVDGGQEWGVLSSLTVADEAGAERPATNRDVTHLRWVIAEIAPDQTGSVSFRAQVR